MKTWDVTIQYRVIANGGDGRPVPGRAIEYREIVNAATAEGAIEEAYTLAKESMEYKLHTEFLSALWVKEIDFSKVAHI